MAAMVTAFREAKRAELAERTADVLLAAGVAQLPLRDLATRFATSDRMILYYFEDKAELVQSSLDVVASRFAAALANADLPERSRPGGLLQRLVRLVRSDRLAPYMNVWADIAARGARGEAPFAEIAERHVEHWLDWLETRLEVEDEDPRDVAAAILVVVEGSRQLEATAPGVTSHAGQMLSQAFAKL